MKCLIVYGESMIEKIICIEKKKVPRRLLNSIEKISHNRVVIYNPEETISYYRELLIASVEASQYPDLVLLDLNEEQEKENKKRDDFLYRLKRLFMKSSFLPNVLVFTSDKSEEKELLAQKHPTIFTYFASNLARELLNDSTRLN